MSKTKIINTKNDYSNLNLKVKSKSSIGSHTLLKIRTSNKEKIILQMEKCKLEKIIQIDDSLFNLLITNNDPELLKILNHIPTYFSDFQFDEYQSETISLAVTTPIKQFLQNIDQYVNVSFYIDGIIICENKPCKILFSVNEIEIVENTVTNDLDKKNMIETLKEELILNINNEIEHHKNLIKNLKNNLKTLKSNETIDLDIIKNIQLSIIKTDA
jgi:hypothetical protein